MCRGTCLRSRLGRHIPWEAEAGEPRAYQVPRRKWPPSPLGFPGNGNASPGPKRLGPAFSHGPMTSPLARFRPALNWVGTSPFCPLEGSSVWLRKDKAELCQPTGQKGHVGHSWWAVGACRYPAVLVLAAPLSHRGNVLLITVWM